MSTNNSGYLKSRILSRAACLGAATFLSRITGFFRDVVLAYFFGTGLAMQSFIIAFRLPNLLRSLIGEGAANTTLVPVFSKMLSQDKRERFLKLSQVLFKVVLISLVVIVLFAQVLSPLLVRIIAPGFLNDPLKLDLTIRLARITFVYLLLISLVAFNTAILNSLNNFATSAISPVLLNLSLILGAFLSHKFLNQPILGLAWAVIVGGILQLLVQTPSLIRNKVQPWRGFFHFKIDKEIKDDSRRIGRLFWPRVLGAAVYQINVFVDTIIASISFLVGTGAVAAIYYANRIIYLPLGVFAFALSGALLPQLSSLAAEKNKQKLSGIFISAMKVIMVVMIPISLFIGILATPIIKAIFQRGQFSSYSVQITSWALLFYSLGLFFFAAIKIVLSFFYAVEDTRSPVKIAIVCLVVNVFLNIILALPLKVGGLALASSLAAVLNLNLLCRTLKKHIPDIDYSQIFGLHFLKVAISTAIMALGIKLSWQYLFRDWPLLLRLIFNLSLAAFIYIQAGLLCKIDEIKGSWQWILKRH